MKPGNKGKSIEAHKQDGTFRADRHGDGTPLLQMGRVRPNPSAHLSDQAKAHFEALVDELWEAGVLDGADRALVELAAIEAATIEQCNDILAGGLTRSVIRGGYNGSEEREIVEVHPMVSVREAAMKHQRQLLELLGIGPAARADLASRGIKGKQPEQAIPAVAKFAEARSRLRAVGNE